VDWCGSGAQENMAVAICFDSMREHGQIAIGENDVPSFQIECDLLGGRAGVDRKCHGPNNEVSHTPFKDGENLSREKAATKR
jgi:hypothetical protein